MSEHENRAQLLQSLAEDLGIGFDDYGLLDRALTHASAFAGASPEQRSDYESLEFIGDAVLGLAVADELLKRVPDRTPGEYSKMRAGVVSRRVLAGAARRLNIASAIRLGRGEEKSGGRRRTALLADCMEAILGAVYLDQGWEKAREFICRTLEKEIDRSLNDETVWDYRSRLQNYCQADRLDLPEFEMVRAEGPDHKKRFEVQVCLRGQVVGFGKGSSKKAAEQAASRAALIHEKQLEQ